jgi:DNA polymerase elongation subunit (family B)
MTTKLKQLPRLFFDIETVAMKNVEKFLPEPKVDKRLKDQEQARADKIAEMVERAPLDADLATVKLISMQIGTAGLPIIALCTSKKYTKAQKEKLSALVPDNRLMIGSEKEIITRFWEGLNMTNGCSVGYNTMGFDFPFIMRRSMDLGIRPGITPNLAKYRTEPTTDLMGILFNWSWGENIKKLKWIASRYNLEVLAPEVDGAMVADMTDEELITYGLSDLHITVQLYERMNGIYFNHLGE